MRFKVQHLLCIYLYIKGYLWKIYISTRVMASNLDDSSVSSALNRNKFYKCPILNLVHPFLWPPFVTKKIRFKMYRKI